MNYAYHLGSGLLHTAIGLSDFKAYTTLTDYEPTGKIGQMDHDNDTITVYTYDPWTTRLAEIDTWNTLNQNDIQRKTYVYSPAGDIDEVTDRMQGITYTYQYDSLHRLISETNSSGAPPNPADVGIVINTYDGSHAHAASSVEFNATSYNIAYDANGNMTSGFDFSNAGQVAQQTIQYNADNMPVQILHSLNGTTNFLYDGGSKRAKKSVVGGSNTVIVKSCV